MLHINKVYLCSSNNNTLPNSVITPPRRFHFVIGAGRVGTAVALSYMVDLYNKYLTSKYILTENDIRDKNHPLIPRTNEDVVVLVDSDAETLCHFRRYLKEESSLARPLSTVTEQQEIPSLQVPLTHVYKEASKRGLRAYIPVAIPFSQAMSPPSDFLATPPALSCWSMEQFDSFITARSSPFSSVYHSPFSLNICVPLESMVGHYKGIRHHRGKPQGTSGGGLFYKDKYDNPDNDATIYPSSNQNKTNNNVKKYTDEPLVVDVVARLLSSSYGSAVCHQSEAGDSMGDANTNHNTNPISRRNKGKVTIFTRGLTENGTTPYEILRNKVLFNNISVKTNAINEWIDCNSLPQACTTSPLTSGNITTNSYSGGVRVAPTRIEYDSPLADSHIMDMISVACGPILPEAWAAESCALLQYLHRKEGDLVELGKEIGNDGQRTGDIRKTYGNLNGNCNKLEFERKDEEAFGLDNEPSDIITEWRLKKYGLLPPRSATVFGIFGGLSLAQGHSSHQFETSLFGCFPREGITTSPIRSWNEQRCHTSKGRLRYLFTPDTPLKRISTTQIPSSPSQIIDPHVAEGIAASIINGLAIVLPFVSGIMNSKVSELAAPMPKPPSKPISGVLSSDEKLSGSGAITGGNGGGAHLLPLDSNYYERLQLVSSKHAGVMGSIANGYTIISTVNAVLSTALFSKAIQPLNQGKLKANFCNSTSLFSPLHNMSYLPEALVNLLSSITHVSMSDTISKEYVYGRRYAMFGGIIGSSIQGMYQLDCPHLAAFESTSDGIQNWCDVVEGKVERDLREEIESNAAEISRSSRNATCGGDNTKYTNENDGDSASNTHTNRETNLFLSVRSKTIIDKSTEVILESSYGLFASLSTFRAIVSLQRGIECSLDTTVKGLLRGDYCTEYHNISHSDGLLSRLIGVDNGVSSPIDDADGYNEGTDGYVSENDKNTESNKDSFVLLSEFANVAPTVAGYWKTAEEGKFKDGALYKAMRRVDKCIIDDGGEGFKQVIDTVKRDLAESGIQYSEDIDKLGMKPAHHSKQ